MERSQRFGRGARSNQFSRSSSSWKEHRSRHQAVGSSSNPNHRSNPGSDSYGNIVSNREEELTVSYENNSRRNINPRVSHSGEGESLVDGTSIVGKCPFMCPVEERQQRERLRDLSIFERLDGDPRKTSTSLAVKKFCRTVSSKHVKASDVRPIDVLEETLNYLLKLLDSKEHPFEVVHDFIFDRTRSIRQDLTMQNIVNDQVINMYEKMVRFHIASGYKLHSYGDNPEVSSMCYLNMEQLMKVLASLYHLYEENRKFQHSYDHEPEFYSFYVLLHLDPSQKPEVESLSLWFRCLPSPIIKSKEMCFARKVLRYYRLGYYKQFISTAAAEASAMQCCIIEPYIHQARLLALCCVNYGGYKLHPYPLADLSKILMMKVLAHQARWLSQCQRMVKILQSGQYIIVSKAILMMIKRGLSSAFCLPDFNPPLIFLLISKGDDTKRVFGICCANCMSDNDVSTSVCWRSLLPELEMNFFRFGCELVLCGCFLFMLYTSFLKRIHSKI